MSHLFGLTEITGPLSQFQAARSNRNETLELVTAIHSTFDSAARASDDRLEEAFAMWWGNLDEALQSIMDCVCRSDFGMAVVSLTGTKFRVSDFCKKCEPQETLPRHGAHRVSYDILSD